MRPGQSVTYLRSDGAGRPATVTGLSGSGASGYKVLDLLVDGRPVSGVPHATDRVAGSGYWVVPGADNGNQPVSEPGADLPDKPPARPTKRLRGPWNEDN
jgi:hypothetical protein